MITSVTRVTGGRAGDRQTGHSRRRTHPPFSPITAVANPEQRSLLGSPEAAARVLPRRVGGASPPKRLRWGPPLSREIKHTWEAYAAVEHTSDADLMNERVPPIPLPITHAADERRRHEGRDSRAIDHGEPTPCDYCNRYNTQTRLSLSHSKGAATVYEDIVLAGGVV